MLKSLFPRYSITKPMVETLKKNEPDRWAAADDDLIRHSKSLTRKVGFTEDQHERLVALAVLVELGVYKRTFPDKPPVAEPVAVAVGEPVGEPEYPETMTYGGRTLPDVLEIEGWP